MKSIIESLKWRYATKAFDPEKKISDDDFHELLESLRLAPSSYGLEPWKFLVIVNPELREKLKGASWNQSQVVDASHLLVLCTRKTIDEAYVDKLMERTAKAQGSKVEDLKGFKNAVWGTAGSFSPEKVLAWNQRQVYIALGFLMETAALKGIDTCPMEGFDPKQYDEILGLEEYTATVVCPVGYRSADDKYASKNKVRLSQEEVIEFRN